MSNLHELELVAWRTPEGRVEVEMLLNGASRAHGDFDPGVADDRKRCATELHSYAPAVTIKTIETRLDAIDLDALELRDEAGRTWRRPDRLPDPLPGVMPYRSDLLPQAIGDAVDDIAERMQCPPDFPAAAMLVALGAVIGCRIGIRPRRFDNWLVVPNLWGMVIGRPSLKKSPAISPAERELRHIEDRDAELRADAINEAAIQMRINEAERKAQQKNLDKAASASNHEDMQRAATAIQALEGHEMPVARRIVTSDPTIEALGALLQKHPAGMILWVDELIGWVQSLDREDRAGVRSQFMTLWNGMGKLNIDRITRGETVVESPCLSVFGCCVPGTIGDYIGSAMRGGKGDDGLIQRLQIAVWPDSPREYELVDRIENSAALRALRGVFERMADLDPSSIAQRADESDRIPWLRFAPDAQELFDAWDVANNTRARSDKHHPAFESHLSKYAKMVPSIALILHLAMDGDGPVSRRAVKMALAWREYLESHARRIYAIAACPERQSATSLLRHLIRWPKDKPIRKRAIRLQNWSGLHTDREIEATLDLLIDLGWVQSMPKIPGSVGGRSTTDYILHPEAEKELQRLEKRAYETIETPDRGGFGGFDGPIPGMNAGANVAIGRERGVI